MKTTIYLVSVSSYTDSDFYLYSNVEVFTDEKEARKQFEHDCDYFREECAWGSAFDLTPEEREEEEAEPYIVTEEKGDNVYVVSSEAYEGYKVKVTLTTKEVESRHDRAAKCRIGDRIKWVPDGGTKAHFGKVEMYDLRIENDTDGSSLDNSCYKVTYKEDGEVQTAWVYESEITHINGKTVKFE